MASFFLFSLVTEHETIRHARYREHPEKDRPP